MDVFRIGKIYSSKQPEPKVIYEEYESALLNTIKQIKKIDINFKEGIKEKNYSIKEKISYLLPRKLKNFLKRF